MILLFITMWQTRNLHSFLLTSGLIPLAGCHVVNRDIYTRRKGSPLWLGQLLDRF